VNPVGRHRHTYYIVSHSELFGFTPIQRQIIAIIARFQGNSKPQLKDRLLKILPAHLRPPVVKATALLRVARALNHGRRGAIQSVRITVRGERVTVNVKASKEGAGLELWAADKEVSYFREVFGRELVFKPV
jgi:exopolyphosphatase/guanosine-5'-triphosphate,3'-diphosphate pyrophosphatase